MGDGALHHFHGILRQGLENPAGSLFQLGTFTVRQASDASEYLSLFVLLAHRFWRITQFTLQPVLDQGILAMVFVIADEPGQAVSKMPGASPGGTRRLASCAYISLHPRELRSGVFLPED